MQILFDLATLNLRPWGQVLRMTKFIQNKFLIFSFTETPNMEESIGGPSPFWIKMSPGPNLIFFRISFRLKSGLKTNRMKMKKN